MQMSDKEITILIGVSLTMLSFFMVDSVDAQDIAREKQKLYPLAFNETGQLKDYDDCGYEEISSDSQGVDKSIIEFALRTDIVNTPASIEPTSFDLNNLGLDDFSSLQQNIEEPKISQQQIDCLIDIREVEKSKKYKDCGYTGENSTQAVDERLSTLSMEIIPITSNETLKSDLQKEANCLVEIRSLEKQKANSDYALTGGKFLAYKIVDGEVLMKNYTECIGHKTLNLSPETIDMRINSMTIDILNDDLGEINMPADKKEKWETERNCLIAIRNTELGIW
jgi:hypothetical protein